MYQLEATYWWHVGKLKILEALIRFCGLPQNAQILDVGCGTGSVIQFLQKFGAPEGIDISEEAVRFCQKRGISKVSVGNASSLPYKDKSFDFVIASDLLEHIEDDVIAIQQMHRVLKKGGFLIITVPAHKFLWSEHDEALGHRRRYTRNELLTKLKTAGFEVERINYSVFFAFPIIFIYRTLQVFFIRSGSPKTSYVILPEFINRFLIKSLDFEAKLFSFVNLPIGVTINVIAKNKGSVKGGVKRQLTGWKGKPVGSTGFKVLGKAAGRN